METTKTILIADRNPHIRDFLRRELAGCGYRVHSVDNAADLLRLIYSDSGIDLLVLDPDIPCLDAPELANKIIDRIPQLPVVLHSVPGSNAISIFNASHVVFIEKNGGSVELLKRTIQQKF